MRILPKLGSIKLTIALLAAVALSGLAGTFLPQADANRWVYRSAWFTFLLLAVAVNLASCLLLRRRSWSSKLGFFVTHAAFLVIIAGAAIDATWGFRGRMNLRIGETSQRCTTDTGSVFELPFAIRLDNFVVERHPGKAILTLLNSQHQAQRATFHPQENNLYKLPGSELSFRVDQLTTNAILTEQLLTAADSNTWGVSGALRSACCPDQDILLLETAPTEFISPDRAVRVTLEVFADPAGRAEALGRLQPVRSGDNGHIEITQDGQTLRIPALVGEQQTLASGKLVTIQQYLPHFSMGDQGISSASDRPVNPAVQIIITGADADAAPVSQWLFSRFPSFNHLHGQDAAITGKYVRASVLNHQVNVFLLAVRDGDLEYAVVQNDGSPIRTGSIRNGDQIALAEPEHHLLIKAALPRAARQTTATPAGPAQKGGHILAGTLLDTATATAPTSWVVQGPKPTRLGQTSFYAGLSAMPGSIKDFKSALQVVATDQSVVREQTIEVNHPLIHGGFAFYQSSYDQQNEAWSGLEVVKAPGVPVIFAGFTLFIAGMIFDFFVQPWLLKRRQARHSSNTAQERMS